MKDRGFTLIELLAVIVILAIIALIATPIVLNMISSAKDSSDERSAELYLDAVEQAVARKNLTEEFSPNSCEVQSDGNLMCDDIVLEIRVENTRPTGGIINFENGRILPSSTLIINGRTISAGKILDDSSNTHTYKIGDVVYFDVSSGSTCTEAEYQKSSGTYESFRELNGSKETVTDYGNSKSGYNGIDNKDANQNSCLKFYVVGGAGDRITLILDHNTSDEVHWSETTNYKNGPITALSVLKNDTKDWKGTLKPANYTYKRAANICYGDSSDDKIISKDCDAMNYTIDYNGYNARLITAEEVAKIANISTDLNKTKVVALNQSSISTDELKTKVGWLYDRIIYVGYEIGMPNKPITNKDIVTGYWTATASSWFYDDGDDNPYAISVKPISLKSSVTLDHEIGVRPVIEVHISGSNMSTSEFSTS